MSFDFAAVTAPFRMQPGLRRLAAGSAQLTPNAPDAPALREKLEALARHPGAALLCADGFDPLAALAALERQAVAEHPGAWRVDPDGDGVEAPQLGWALRGGRPARTAGPAESAATSGDATAGIGDVLSALSPEWRRPALLALAFAEDFAILDGDSARIPWLAVCLPSHWRPADKVGRHFAEVHAPVADNRVLLAASEHLARLVTGDEPWERFVWTVTHHAALNGHPDRVPTERWHAADDADALAAHAHWRTEHQTFIPVPGRRQAVFTIHVDSRPLAAAIDTPERAAAVHAAIASMSAAVLEYRGLTDARERLLDWLARRAGAVSPNGEGSRSAGPAAGRRVPK